MLSRRGFCCAGIAAASATLAFPALAAGEQCAVQTRELQSALSSDDALNELKAGNERFLTRRMRNCDLLGQVRATAAGQFPFAAVIGCIDSRVPPELVFDQQIGDIFSVRVAGNVAPDEVIGSVEFATRLAGAKLIVVLGHSECGAVKGAIDGTELGHLTSLLARIRPAVEASRNAPGEHRSSNKAFVQQVATAHARMTAEGLKRDSEILRDLAGRRELRIVAAMHDVTSGRVTFLE